MTEPLLTGGQKGYLRIATEEAFATQEQLDAIMRLVKEGRADKGTMNLWGFYGTSPSERTTFIRERLLDLGELRIQAMDDAGIDKAVLALTSPGVQSLFDLDEARGIASRANDHLKTACERYPDRFVGMAAVCPQDAEWSAQELKRAKEELGFVGVQINSHTHGHYLDEPQFEPILRACAELDMPLYIHPQGPPDDMIGTMAEVGLEGAVFGFAVETSFHALRLLTSGAFDRYPSLKLVLGHGCEGLPFWIDRLNFMHQAGIRSGRYERMKPQNHELHYYLRNNVWGTNSGLPSPASIKLMMEVMGEDRVMYAMDYPYQYVPDEVRLLDAMDLPRETMKKFYQTNAEALFGI
ncbi:amidohydrolase [Aurantiacibacter xanthus]|uniref:Amidohydrolase n=1 Tax=Aurantiacibacter xanthus TaxID=1784712 RepID=A0A3A1P3Y6_9SPHN|nr:amidohydrolase family protein [Aurantiacibacter xanthus]RIV83005.1 amidohydrolase [Aurantiacibacter xanthus]